MLFRSAFSIQIDSIRKSLGIDNMDDVELLVMTFYEFAERQRQEALASGMSHDDQHSEDHASNAGAANKKGPKASSVVVNEAQKGVSNVNVNQQNSGTEPDQNPVDDDNLVIDNDDIVIVLKDFHKKREERMNNAELVGNPRMKKRSNFETEEQKKERIKKEERMFWEKMTSVLDDKKLSTWKALDKALTKYYALLVDR